MSDQAKNGGLWFEAYLPSGLASWLLECVNRGVYADPAEAVFAIMLEYKDLAEHEDLRQELLRRKLEARWASIDKSVSVEKMREHLRDSMQTHQSAAYWLRGGAVLELLAFREKSFILEHLVPRFEPHRVCRRPWVVSHAAISMLSAAA